VCKADNLSPSCAVVKKSGSLNFLEPSAPLPLPEPVTGLLYLLLPLYQVNMTEACPYFNVIAELAWSDDPESYW